MINILIADDQILLRKSLEQIISIDEEINVIALAENGKEAIEMCKLHKPNIIMLDIEMPGMDGISALEIIKKNHPETKVIMLTTFENKKNIISSMKLGASAFISKDIEPEELISVIKCVNMGFTIINNEARQILLKNTERETSNDQLLSDEEKEIVKLVVEGRSNKNIASKLNYSEGTIKNKVSKIYSKLGLTDRLQLAVYAMENRLE